MAVAKKCDLCGKFYEGTRENQFTYEENGDNFHVNSFRIGDWNARTKSWNSLASAYDICKDCGKKLAQAVFDIGENLTTRRKIHYDNRQVVQEETNEPD